MFAARARTVYQEASRDISVLRCYPAVFGSCANTPMPIGD